MIHNCKPHDFSISRQMDRVVIPWLCGPVQVWNGVIRTWKSDFARCCRVVVFTSLLALDREAPECLVLEQVVHDRCEPVGEINNVDSVALGYVNFIGFVEQLSIFNQPLVMNFQLSTFCISARQLDITISNHAVIARRIKSPRPEVASLN